MTAGAYEATYPGGWSVFVTKLDVARGVSNEGPPPATQAFGLAQNHPNPFTGRTTISFTLPTREHVHVAVYDLLGRRVKTLLDRELPPGPHAVEMDAPGLSAGVYPGLRNGFGF